MTETSSAAVVAPGANAIARAIAPRTGRRGMVERKGGPFGWGDDDCEGGFAAASRQRPVAGMARNDRGEGRAGATPRSRPPERGSANPRRQGDTMLRILALVAGAALVALPHPARALDAAQAEALAIDAYVYGYPLVTMEMTRRVMTNVAAPEGTRAPMGHLIRLRTYPDASFRDVTAPNADTLYTTAWLDVGEEPWILRLPDAAGRYYLMPLLDGWTEVFEVPGKRTTGTGPQTYAITGPGWKGELPEGVVRYESPTSLVWLLGRIYCTGTSEDYAAVHALQDAISLFPLG